MQGKSVETPTECLMTIKFQTSTKERKPNLVTIKIFFIQRSSESGMSDSAQNKTMKLIPKCGLDKCMDFQNFNIVQNVHTGSHFVQQ